MTMRLLLTIAGRNRTLIVMVALLALLAISLGWYASSQRTILDSLHEQWNKSRSRLTAMDKRDATVIYQQGIEDLRQLRQRIAPRLQFPRILGFIVREADRIDVDLADMTYRPRVIKDENLLAYDLKISVTGTYTSVKSFLVSMLSARDFIVVEGIRFSASDPFETDVTLDLQVSVYLREDGQ